MMHVMQLLTDANEDIYDRLFGDTTKSDEIFDFLKTKHGLTEIEGIKKVVHATSGVNRALTFGWGMKQRFQNNLLAEPPLIPLFALDDKVVHYAFLIFDTYHHLE